jgi:hypothetical protein
LAEIELSVWYGFSSQHNLELRYCREAWNFCFSK